MRLSLFALFACLFLITSCTGLPSNNERWDSKAPKASGAPKGLATPGSYSGDADSGAGPFAEGGVAFQTDTGIDLPPVKVAILLPLTGRGAEVGNPMLNAAQLALFDLGANTFELIQKDTGGTAAGAASAAQDAVNEGAQLILGPLFSHSVKAVRPIAERARINVVGFSTDWVQAGGNIHLMGFMPFTQVEQVTNFSASSGTRNIALIVKNDAYSGAVERTFTSAANARGIRVPNIIRLGASGLTASDITALRVASIDGVFIAAGGAEAANISLTLQQSGLSPLSVKRIGTGLWDDPVLAREPSMDGGIFAASAPNQRTVFEKNYQDLYATKPPRLASLAYDATALAAVLGKMGTVNASGIYVPAYTSANLKSPNGFSGIDGVFRFNNRGLAERQLAILEFRNRQIVEIKPAAARF